MSTEEEQVSDWTLERYLLGELPEARLRWIEALLPARPDLVSRVEAMRQSNEALLRRHPPRVVAAGVADRLAPTRTMRGLRWGAAVAAVAVVAGVAVRAGSAPDEDLGERTKGLGATMRIHRQVPGGSERLADGMEVAAGDVLQLTFAPGVASEAAVLSVDGRGQVTVHFPGPGQGTHIGSGLVHVDHGFELDDAPNFERFFLVTSLKPLDLDDIQAAARALAAGSNAETAPLVLEADQDVASLLLRKEADE